MPAFPIPRKMPESAILPGSPNIIPRNSGPSEIGDWFTFPGFTLYTDNPFNRYNYTRSTMLEALITSKTRLKLLTKFFLNPQAKAYLRELERSFGESSNAVRLELNRFEEAGLLNSTLEGNRKVFIANTRHPLFLNIHNILRTHLGIDRIVEEITGKLGNVKEVWLSGEFAKGNDSDFIELLLIGTSIDQEYLEKLRAKATSLISRTIRITLLTPEAFIVMKSKIKETDIFLLWEAHPEI